MPLQIVLMGTGTFAVPAFRAMLDSNHHVAAIVTQPDRTGRGHHRHVNPVLELGRTYSVPVLQPERAADSNFQSTLQDLQPDVIVVAAYGQILKRSLLAIPRLGAFNLHGSLLPRHRGAAPVQYAIWKGDSLTGVTMFRIEPALDSGPIVGVVSTQIAADETSGSLMDRLADLCVPLTLSVLDQLERGTATLNPQNESEATLAPRIQKSAGQIDWTQSPREIDCHVRAMLPWPKAASTLIRPGKADLRCIFHEVEPLSSGSQQQNASQPVGTVSIHDRLLAVRCGQGGLQVLRLQPEGGRVVSAADFINGQSELTPSSFR